MTNPPDAYFITDRTREDCMAIADKRSKWEDAEAREIAKRWDRELKSPEGYIEDLNMEYGDVLKLSLKYQTKFAVQLKRLAAEYVTDNNLFDNLSWD